MGMGSWVEQSTRSSGGRVSWSAQGTVEIGEHAPTWITPQIESKDTPHWDPGRSTEYQGYKVRLMFWLTLTTLHPSLQKLMQAC